MFEKIRDVISEKIGIDKEKITMESTFVGDLNIDSISMIDLIMELEDEYGIEFDEDDAGSDNLFHNGIMLSYRARHNAEG